MQNLIPFTWRKDGKAVKAFLVIIMLFVLMVLCSCSNSKALSKHHSISDSAAVTHTVATQTITERIDTTVTIQGSTLTATKAIDELQAGDSLFEETPTQVITTKIVKGRVKTTAVVKAQVVPVVKVKTTVAKVNTDQTVRVKTTGIAKEVQRQSNGLNLNYAWWFLSLPRTKQGR